jgi:hypothetical protein
MAGSVNKSTSPIFKLERSLLATLGDILRDVGWLGEAQTSAAEQPVADGADAVVHLG